jgi:hypothetical protein
MRRDHGLGKDELKVRTSSVALLEASNQLAQHLRTSPAKELVASLQDFLQASEKCEEMITDRHAAVIRSVWHHLQKDESGRALLTEKLATQLLKAMANFDYGRGDAGLLRGESLVKCSFQPAYIALANELTTFIMACPIETEIVSSPNLSKLEDIIPLQIKCHKNAGFPLETLEIVRKHWSAANVAGNWTDIIEAVSTNRNALLQICDAQDKIPTAAYDEKVIALLVSALIEAGETGMALKWLDTFKRRNVSDFGIESLTAMLLACVKAQDAEAASEVLRRAAILRGLGINADNHATYKAWYDADVAWAVASGADFEDIKSLLSDMTEAPHPPDSSTLNAVVKTAYQVSNPDLAFKVISERRKWNLEEDGYTCLHQLNYRMSQKDLQQSVELWQTIQSRFQEDISRRDMADMLERLIVTNLSANSPNIELLEDLLDAHKSVSRRFTPEALTELTSYHLYTANYEDAVKLLRDHVPRFTFGARKLVIDMLLKFAFSSPADADRAWNAYLILTSLFEEVDRPIIERFMESFFAAHAREHHPSRTPDHETPDEDAPSPERRLEQALTAFLFMRNSARPAMRPDESVYLAALRAFTRARSRAGVRKVHNQLKLDARVDPSPRLHAELTVAYAHCADADLDNVAGGGGGGDGGALRFFWAGMLDPTAEGHGEGGGGVDEAGVVCALYACERAPDGEAGARAVWGGVGKSGAAVSRNVFRAYVRALVASGAAEAGMEEIGAAGERYGFDGGFA